MYFKANMKKVKNKNDVPLVNHYAIIVYETTSVYHEGDERSRTNPGHGYPAHTETFDAFEHYVSLDKAEWLKAIEEFAKHEDKKDRFVAFEAKVARILTKVVVEIE